MTNDPVLITGGAGFIGSNLAGRLLSEGRRVIIYDNLGRSGVETNLEWLRNTYGNRIEFIRGDVRDGATVRQTVARCSAVFHLAAQVAVTSSLVTPVEDFEINARGTINVLEAIRTRPEPIPLVFTSTNKVYGDLNEVCVRRLRNRYEPTDEGLRNHGASEDTPLQFHSPYGCSKGAADQYVLDYARSYRLPVTVFRMSCIYGPHQFGTEDQGWVAHFLIRALNRRPITLYGDGLQVRDLLFVEDLVNAFLLAVRHMDHLAGQAFNIGGGPANAMSLLELLHEIGKDLGEHPSIRFEDWRAADQKYYVSDTRRFEAAVGWRPRVSISEGLTRLRTWLIEESHLIEAPTEVHGGAAA